MLSPKYVHQRAEEFIVSHYPQQSSLSSSSSSCADSMDSLDSLVMVMSRISVKSLLIEARALELLVFFMIAEWVAGKALNMAVNPRIVVCMRSRTDNDVCANANYGQLKIHKRSQNFSLQQLFVVVYKSSDCAL